MSIKAKLTGILAVTLVIVIAIGAFGVFQMRSMNANAVDLYSNWVPAVRDLGLLKYEVARIRIFAARLTMPLTPETRAQVKDRMAKEFEAYDKLANQYISTITGPEEQKVWDRFKDSWTAYLAGQNKLIAMTDKGDLQEAVNEYNTTSVKLFEQALANLDADVQFQNDGAAAAGAQADATYARAFWIFSGAILLATLFVGASIVWVSKDIIAPLGAITTAMRNLADGVLTTFVPYAERTDEVGEMAAGLNVFKENLIAKKEADEQAEADAKLKLERAQRMERSTREFERSIGAIVDVVAAASTELSATAENLNNTSGATTSRSTAVAAASEEASTNVHTVASAAEQLSSSIREISEQVQQSNRVAQEAAREADQTSEAVRSLAEMAERIGNIVNLINNIAAQTNMLALNATIEAARAGEAGRGFAVVAQEVKALAEQTAKATAEIVGQITGIQESSRLTNSSMSSIAKTIDNINSISAAIAAAIEEQGAATQEIARNASQTSDATTDVARNITGVQEAAESSAAAANQVLSSSRDLAKQADNLRAEVRKYLNEVQAA